ncbi:MAG: hypothetical protein ACXVXP_00295 [Mycobacteriaceae bacterium]
MSAATLRRAAALMRRRANTATLTAAPWAVDEIGAVWALKADGQPLLISSRSTDQDAEHIASWHPAVALAVADLLDLAATHQVAFTPVVRPRLLTIARAYLGEEADRG